ncbi:MAG: RNA polymerase-associated protein RapA [Xanthomonadales bacterium]|nr:RNA polymerase-associated protein RapA [Xanthomonadales bacterium]
MSNFAPGQRWISNAEPELGLGTVLRVEGRMVQLVYARTGTVRQYAAQSAPLTRAQFRIGDLITLAGRPHRVDAVDARDGLLHYAVHGTSVCETGLDDLQNVSKAEDRLGQGRIDRNDQFEFRHQALIHRAQARRSAAFGLQSARVDLIPHQLRVAQIVADRRPPRVLLADEVGLGKTIEAGLIIARQIASGRAGRVLVLVPETLVYQWFVELLRRFNLAFSIYDAERVEAIELNADGRNPFEDDELVITDSSFIVANPERAKQLVTAGWDLLVIDEAHHLAWSPEEESSEYVLAEALAKRTPGVVLLTATPEQLGRSGHFARLRLLDPARYHDLAAFQQQTAEYAKLSVLAAALIEGEPLSNDDQHTLTATLGDTAQMPEDDEARDAMLAALIDRHGTGRVMFRNRRAVVGGFPKRLPELVTLPDEQASDDLRGHLLAEFLSDVDGHAHALPLNYAKDPRLAWLVALFDEFPADKFLLICRSQAKVLALEEALRAASGVAVARFHEGMSIVQRDRNAAFFQSAEGARLLLCAEIGSEGRNFQFAHHLVFWDLPPDPDQLEQRIGRLDRIGQKRDVNLHFAKFRHTAQEALVRWFDEGLDAFRSSPQDGRELLRRFGAELVHVAREYAAAHSAAEEALESLIRRTQTAHRELAAAIQNGRDRLLELATQRAAPDALLQHALHDDDHNPGRDEFVLKLFEQFGISSEELSGTIHLLDPEYLSTEGFPGFEHGPRQATFDRTTALTREDVLFLRVDHPMVQGALDLLLGAETGNAAFLVDPALPPRSALLEAVFLLECVAPAKLHVDRFLPPLPLRAVVDSRLSERPDYQPSDEARRRASELTIDLGKLRKVLNQLLPPMLKTAQAKVERLARREVEGAMLAADQRLEAEIERLVALAAVNPGVRAEEIAAATDEKQQLHELLPESRVRLDAVRLIVSPDFLTLANRG